MARRILFLSLLILSVCARTAAPQARPAAAQSRVTFVEVPSKESGISWAHNNAMSPQRYLPETVGAGCAFFDFDNDGWMDVYLVNSGPSDFYQPKPSPRNALYRNNRNGTFTDVTDKAGVAGETFGMGAAAGDYDGDGWQDLYVTAYGRNVLYRNNGDGTFTDVTAKAGVAAPGWSTCATWFDFDKDGRLDLFVSSFVLYNKETSCGNNRLGRNFYCIPRIFKPRPTHLFRNNGDGTFADVSAASGIAGSPGKSFGAVATDVNNDGLSDLFVANDTMPNFLFVNKGGGKFEEVGLAAGVAYGEAGNPRSGMGVDAADYDNDGWQDLFVANIDQELFSLYNNQKDLTFTDEPGEIAPATRLLSGWGLKFFDYDNDGDSDLFLANGHPDDMVETVTPRVKYKEPILLFENTGRGFDDVSAAVGRRLLEDVPGARDDRGRLRQRRRPRPAHLQQRRGARPAAERGREPQQLGRARPRRRREGQQPGRGRRRHHVAGRRAQTDAPEDERRQLPRLARPARDSRPRAQPEGGRRRDSLAERQGR